MKWNRELRVQGIPTIWVTVTKDRSISHAEMKDNEDQAWYVQRIVYTFRTNASRISRELSTTVTPYYGGGQRRCQTEDAIKTNLEIIRKITWSRLVVDAGARTRFALISIAGIQWGIWRFGRRRGGTVGRWWDWILAHDEG